MPHFRYQQDVGRLAKRGTRRTFNAAFLVGVMGWAVACQRGPGSPQEALQKIQKAVQTRDAETLFDALDQETRWSWMTIQRCHREAYDAVLSNFPEGPERQRALARFEAGAMAENADHLFAVAYGDRALADLLPRLPAATAQAEVNLDRATFADAKGRPMLFVLIEKRWGFSGFAGPSEELKKRAVADLELIQQSATDYERAAKRGIP